MSSIPIADGNSLDATAAAATTGAGNEPCPAPRAPIQPNVSWTCEHWSSGIVGGLAVVDAIVLLLCLTDLLHFWATGLSTEVAWALLFEKPRFQILTEVLNGVFTFGVFFLLLPAASAAVIAVFKHLASKADTADDKLQAQPKDASDSGKPFLVTSSAVKIRSLLYQRISKSLVRPSRRIWLFHLFSALVIACFTVLMKYAVILEGNAFTPDAEPHPAFFSAWLYVVSTWKILTPAVFLPVLRKYMVRMFGGEHPHIFHVFSEVFSEDYGVKE